MAKAIINDKLYDTEKAEELLAFTRRTTTEVRLFTDTPVSWPSTHMVKLYKTAKGRYFEHDMTAERIQPVAESTARDIVRECDPDLYVKLFGEVEEA